MSEQIPQADLSDFCRGNKIHRLAFFGSRSCGAANASSDLDVLVEFEPDARVGLLTLARLELELSDLLGIQVDLNTPDFLDVRFRDRVMREAKVQYEAA